MLSTLDDGIYPVKIATKKQTVPKKIRLLKSSASWDNTLRGRINHQAKDCAYLKDAVSQEKGNIVIPSLSLWCGKLEHHTNTRHLMASKMEQTMSESLNSNENTPNDALDDDLDLEGLALDEELDVDDLNLDDDEEPEGEKPEQEDEEVSQPNPEESPAPGNKNTKGGPSSRTQKKHEERLMLQDFILKPMSELEDRAEAIRKAAAEAAAIEDARRRLEAQQKREAEKKEAEKQNELDMEREEEIPEQKWVPASETVSQEGLEKINGIFDEPLLQSALKEDGSLNFEAIGNDGENKIRRTFRTLMGMTPTWKLLEHEDMIHGRPALKRLAVLCLTQNPTEEEKEKEAHLDSFFDMHENTQSRDDITFECGFSATYNAANTKVIVTDSHTLVQSTSKDEANNFRLYSGFPFKKVYLVIEGGRNMLCSALHEESRLFTKDEISARADERIQNFTNLPIEELISHATSLRSKLFSSTAEETVVANAERMLTTQSDNLTSNIIPTLPTKSHVPTTVAPAADAPPVISTYMDETDLIRAISNIKSFFEVKGKTQLTKEGINTLLQSDDITIKMTGQRDGRRGYNVAPLEISLASGLELTVRNLSQVSYSYLSEAMKVLSKMDAIQEDISLEDRNELEKRLTQFELVSSNIFINDEAFVLDRARFLPPLPVAEQNNPERRESPEI